MINPDNPSQGGGMGNIPTAAFDPIFWAHHCMIDRIWYLWQVKYGVDNIPPSCLDLKLAPFGYEVKDVLDINSLGYEYVTSAAATAGAGAGAGPGAGPGAGQPADAAQAAGPAQPVSPAQAAEPAQAAAAAAPPGPTAAPPGSQP